MLPIKYIGAVYTCSGYTRTRHLLVELSKLGVSIKTQPFKIQDDVKFHNCEILKSLEYTDISSPYIAIVNGIALQIHPDPNACFNIGYTMFEANALPKEWVQFLNKMDEIWVPSHTNSVSFELSKVQKNIEVIPYGFSSDLFSPIQKRNDIYTFLSIGTYIDRKGWDVLIQSYLEEFNGNDKVRLLIKLDGVNRYAEPEIKSIISKYSNPANISVCNAKVDDKKMKDFYAMADAFVLASRGEAFGLTLLEAMACNLPIITTDHDGPKDFLLNQAHYIKSELKPISSRLGTINQYYRNLWFNEPNKDDLRSLLRSFYENRISQCQYDSEHLNKFSYKNIAKLVYKRLEAISKEFE